MSRSTSRVFAARGERDQEGVRAALRVLGRRVTCAGPLWLPDVSVAGWPLFMASVWRTAPANPTVDGVVDECPKREEHLSSSGHQQASPGGIPMQ